MQLNTGLEGTNQEHVSQGVVTKLDVLKNCAAVTECYKCFIVVSNETQDVVVYSGKIE